ncbi:hypothetical protein ACEXOS_014145 [Herbiconiux sp. P16]|uniref:hypothetical protein n=1 Tax=Herbiconiux wuyangfengii TaxID=3342794 RepID=UPI0035B8057A
MTDSPELSRRTVLAGAAWSVPVVALAVATPAAAASEDTVTVRFAAIEIQLHRSDIFAAIVEITNTSGVDLPAETLQAVFIGLPTDENEFTAEFPEDAETMTDTANGTQPVDNLLFSASGGSNGSLVITSDAPIALSASQTIIFGIYLHRPAHNATQAVYAIAGSFTFGSSVSGSIGGTSVELVD